MKIDLKEVGFLCWIGGCVFSAIFFSMILVGISIGIPFFDGWIIIPLIGAIVADCYSYIKINKQVKKWKIKNC